ncbi:MAG TPA: TA system VapC family ribonuclease toxin [Planctomycetota bacterium]|nr:TA system VapC family ribonuclease toxin [Planctomycetota bacterium]
MNDLLDINVWLASAFGEHEHHEVARAYLETCTSEHTLVFCRLTQLGFLRLATTHAVMRENTCTNEEAWLVLDELMKDERVVLLNEPPGLELKWRKLSTAKLSQPKSWMDDYLCAFALTAGLRVVTFDRGIHATTDVDVLLLEK